jgi:hypothetical protein
MLNTAYAESYVDGVLVPFGVPYITMKLHLTRESVTLNKDRVTPESLSNNPESLRKYAWFVKVLHCIILKKHLWFPQKYTQLE